MNEETKISPLRIGLMLLIIAALGGVVLIGIEDMTLAKDADDAWVTAGLNARGFFGNVAIGCGFAETPRISGTMDFAELGRRELEMAPKRTHELFERLTRP